MQTRAAPRNIVKPAEFKFDSAGIGEVVTVKTLSGSTYYFVRTRGTRNRRGYVYGVVIQTDSKGFGQATEHPDQIGVPATLKVGSAIRFAQGGTTNHIVEIRLNDVVVAS